MTDLAQKIVSAVEEWNEQWEMTGDGPLIDDVIRQALADAGGAVAWQLRRTNGVWSQPTANEVTVEVARENNIEVRALYTHPDSGRVAELEDRLGFSEAACRGYVARVTELEAQLTASREVGNDSAV